MHKWTLGLAVLLVGCAGEKLDMGDDPDAGTGGTTGADSDQGRSNSGTTNLPPSDPLPQWTTEASCDTEPEFADLLGTWGGQIEDFYLKPVTKVRIVINGASSQKLCGSVIWGEGDAPPAPTDPDGLYPSAEALRTNAPVLGLPPVEGFAYAIDQGAVRDHSLRFSTQYSEPWKSWCELQTSYPHYFDWGCVPYAKSYSFALDLDGDCEMAGQTFTSFKCQACGGTSLDSLCACNDAACTARDGKPNEFALTLSDDRTELTGPAAGYQPLDGGETFYLKHVD